MPATYDPRPIGVFDSGIGGLTAVREVFRQLPHESVVYFGDTARLPYGNKSAETVTRFSLEIASFLVRQNVKCLLVACGTASSHALDAVRARFSLPVIGVIEPAARTAVGASPHGLIGVIGTLATVGSGSYLNAVHAIAPEASVLSRACPLFVPLVEEGWLDHPVTRLVAEEYLAELRAAKLDSLVLGCTHYPMLASLIGELMGPTVTLVDSGAEAVRAVTRLLGERGQLAPEQGSRGPQHHFFLSDEPRRRSFAHIAQAFLGCPLPHVTVVDQTDLPWFERVHGPLPSPGEVTP